MVQDECDAQGGRRVLPCFLCCLVLVCPCVYCFVFFFDSGSHESELQLDRSAFGWEGRLCAYHPVCKAVLVLWEYKVGYFYKNSLYDSDSYHSLKRFWKAWKRRGMSQLAFQNLKGRSGWLRVESKSLKLLWKSLIFSRQPGNSHSLGIQELSEFVRSLIGGFLDIKS